MKEDRILEVDLSGEVVQLECGVCGKSLYKNTVGKLLLMIKADRLTDVLSDYYTHIFTHGHTNLISRSELVEVDRSGYNGGVGIKLHYP